MLLPALVVELGDVFSSLHPRNDTQTGRFGHTLPAILVLATLANREK
jgi:hypothetical protein